MEGGRGNGGGLTAGPDRPPNIVRLDGLCAAKVSRILLASK